MISMAFAYIRLRSFFLWMLLGFLILVPFDFIPGVTSEQFEMIMGTFVFFVFPIGWLLYKMKQHEVQFHSFIVKPSVWDWKLIVLALGTGLLFSSGISIVQFYLLSHFAPDFLIDFLMEDESIGEGGFLFSFYTIVSTCIFAPIMEELIFRGFFLQRMTYKWGVKKAIVFSALLFGIGHVDVVGAFVFGVVMSLLYLKTKSLRTGMIVHACNNIIATVMSSFGGKSTGNIAELQDPFLLKIAMVMLFLALCWIIPFIWKGWRAAQTVPVVTVAESQVVPLYTKVQVIDQTLVIPLSDDIVQQLRLYEDETVQLDVQDELLIIKKRDIPSLPQQYIR